MKRKNLALILAVMLTATTIGTAPAVTFAQEMGEDGITDTEEQKTAETDLEEPENTDDEKTSLAEEEDTAEEITQEEADELGMADSETAAARTDEQSLEFDFDDDDFSDGSEDASAGGFTRADIELNKETTIKWKGEDDWTKVWFTPPKTQPYVFIVNENGTAGRGYNIFDENDTDCDLQNILFNVDGKTYIKTSELEEGKKYYLYFDAVSGESETQVGVYDDSSKLWGGATPVETKVSDFLGKARKAIMWGDDSYQCTTKIYKITVPRTGAYTYTISGLKREVLGEDDGDWDVIPEFCNEDGTTLKFGNPNYDHSDTTDVSVKLEEGKTYYLKVVNYSVYNAYNYDIIRTCDSSEYTEFVNGKEGTLEAGDSCFYKVNIDKDDIYQFTDPTVSAAGEKLFYMYDSEMENITDEGENRTIISADGKNSLTYTIQLKKGTYYLKLKNNTSKTTSYKIIQQTIALKDVQNISLSATDMKMETGQKRILTASLNPSDVTFKSLNWNISNADVADRVYNSEKDTYEIVAKSAGTCDITVTAKNGKSAVCHVTVVDGHDYQTVTTPATLTQDGDITTKCTICGDIKETTSIPRPTKFQLSVAKYTYDGKVKTPSVTVTDSKGKKLTAADYSVSYAAGRKDAGTYSVKITLKGNYRGSKTLTFTIAKATPKLTVKAFATTINAGVKGKLTVSGAKGTLGYSTSNKKIATVSKGIVTGIKTGTVKLTVTSAATKNYNKATASVTIKVRPKATSVQKAVSAKKGQLTVTWKKNTTTDRYQIQYSTNSKFQKASTVTVTSNAKTSQTITRLASKKKYYVRLRSIDKTGKLYSGWSKALTVTTK